MLEGLKFGRFEVQSEVGAGGMGAVYRGHDPLLDRTVALKIMQAERRMSALAKARFMREARVLSKLDHPNICRIYDFIEGQDSDVLVLEFLDGVTLKQAIRRGVLSREDALSIAHQVCSALASAHAAGIVHRDLKPDNIIILRNKQVKVLDFGLARTEDQSMQLWIDHQLEDRGMIESSASENSETKTTVGTLVGTLAYMSPEQARGDDPQVATDIYALGIVLIEMLTGRRAYPENTAYPVLLGMVAFGKLKPYSREIDHPDILKLVDSAVDPEPQNRPTADQLQTMIQYVLEEPDRNKRRRRNGALSLTGTLLLAALVASVFWPNQPTWTVALDQVQTVFLQPLTVTAEGGAAEGWQQLLVESLSAYGQLDVVTAESGDEVKTLLKTSDFTITSQLQQSLSGCELSFQIRDREHRERRETIRAADPVPALFEGSRKMAFQMGVVGSLARETQGDPFLNEIYALGVHVMRTKAPVEAIPYFEVCLQLDERFYRAALALASCELQRADAARAEQLVRRVIDSAQDGPVDLAAAYLRMGAVLSHQGRVPEALDWFEKAEQQAATASDRRHLARAWLRQSGILRRAGDVEMAERLMARARVVYVELGDLNGQADLAVRSGHMARSQGRFLDAVSAYSEAEKLYRQLDDWRNEARAISGLGTLSRLIGDFDNAERHFNRAMKLHIEAQDISGQAGTYNNLGGLAVRRYDYEIALDYYRRAQALHRLQGNLRSLSISWHNIGWTELQLGHLQAAEEAIGVAIHMMVQQHNMDYASSALVSMAELSVKRGDYDLALQLLPEVTWTFESLQDLSGLARVHFIRGDLAQRLNRWDEARVHYQQALQVFCSTDELEGYMHSTFRLALLDLRTAERQTAEQWLDQLRSWQSQHILTFELQARLARAEGNRADARHWRDLARACAPRVWELEFAHDWMSLL